MEALGGASGISKSKVSRISQGLDEQVKAFLQQPLDHSRFPYVYLDATYPRADSKYQSAMLLGLRLVMASSAVMSCITACRPARIEPKPASRSRFIAAVRRAAITPAPLPR